MDALSGENQRILRSCSEGTLEQVELLIENRERMLNQLAELQASIESEANQLTLSDELLDLLRTWLNDLNLWVERFIEHDRSIILDLTHLKEQTTREIATIYKAREGHKGYNLKSVKK